MSQSQEGVFKELEAEGYTVVRRGWPSFLAYKDGEVRLIKAISPKSSAYLFPDQVAVFNALARVGIVVEVARGSLQDCADYRESLAPPDLDEFEGTKRG